MDLQSKEAVWTRDEVLGIIERLQPTLLPNYHAGLWGSVLTKGQSYKDFDLIIIGHDSDIRNDYDEIAGLLTAFGFTDRQRFDKKSNFLYNECRHIEKWKYNGKRVDVFNLSDEVKIPATVDYASINKSPLGCYYPSVSVPSITQQMIDISKTDLAKYNGF